MRAAILLAGLVLALPACGPGDDGGPAEDWPLRVDAPGVLGYVSMPVGPDDLAASLDRVLAWRPDGLSGDGSFALVLLDEYVHGSPFAVAVPVDDEDAFRASLLASPNVTAGARDAWIFTLPRGNALAQAIQVARSMAGANSPQDILAALGEEPTIAWSMQLAHHDGRAVLAPSYEAGLTVARVLDEVGGLRAADGPLVLSFDAKRMHLAYKQEIDGLVQQVRGMLLNVQMAGLGGMLAAGMRGAEVPELDLPVPGPALWALLEMVGPDEVEGLQVELHGLDVGAWVDQFARSVSDGPDVMRDEVSAALDPVLHVRLRTTWIEGSPRAALLAGVRPAPELPDAVSFAFEPVSFPAALAEWARPLVELTMGEGAPAERLIAEMTELLAPCEGTVLVGKEEGARALVLALQPGRELDVDGFAEVLGLFAHTLDLDDEGLGGPRPWDGAVPPEGAVPAGRYWTHDGAFVLTLDDCGAAGLDGLLGELRDVLGGGAARGPFLSVRQEVPNGLLRAGFYARGRELVLEQDVPVQR